MKITSEDTKNTDSPVAKAVKSFKKRNKPFIRIEKPDTSAENGNVEENKEVNTGARGVIYLGHLPKGFYEEGIRKYFTQFGAVTRVKLARSKKTGNSKGYAFIEFRYKEVAKIAAETMNNYLLFDRLLKANYVDKVFPPSFWYKAPTAETYPGVRIRRKNTHIKNASIAPAKEKKRSDRNMKRLKAALRKLKEKGVNYDVQADDLVSLEDKILAKNAPVLEVDETDKEIEFNVPSYFIKKPISKKDSPAQKQQRKNKNKRPLISSPIVDEVSLDETPKEGEEVSAPKSAKRKTPSRAEPAENLKGEPVQANQRNGASPFGDKSNGRFSLGKTPKRGQENYSPRSAKRKTPLRADSVKDQGNQPSVLGETPEQGKEISAPGSVKGKTPLRADSAVKVQNGPPTAHGETPKQEQETSGPGSSKRKMSLKTDSAVKEKNKRRVSLGGTPKQNPEISAPGSVKGKTPFRTDSPVKVKSVPPTSLGETPKERQENSTPGSVKGKKPNSPVKVKSQPPSSLDETSKQAQETLGQEHATRKTPLRVQSTPNVGSEPVPSNQVRGTAGKRNTRASLGESLKQKQDDSAAQTPVKGKSPSNAASAGNVKGKPKDVGQINGKSPLKNMVKSPKGNSEASEDLAQKGKRQSKLNTPRRFSVRLGNKSEESNDVTVRAKRKSFK